MQMYDLDEAVMKKIKGLLEDVINEQNNDWNRYHKLNQKVKVGGCLFLLNVWS